MVVVGSNATRGAVTVVKSILATRTAPLVIHWVVDGATEAVLRVIMDTWGLGNVSSLYHRIEPLTERVAWVPTAHESGTLGMTKVLYGDVLPASVSRVIALDTDLVFAADIAQLWQQFALFDHTHLVAAAAQQSDWYLNVTPGDTRQGLVWPARGRGLNSGVLLLQLDRLRTRGWHERWPALVQRELQVRRKRKKKPSNEKTMSQPDRKGALTFLVYFL